MIKLFAFARRLPDETPEQFHRHWTDVHARHIAETPEIRRHIRRYELNHRLTEDYERDRHAGEVAGPSSDGVSVYWFDGLEQYRAFVSEPGLQEFAARDTPQFKEAHAPWVVTHEPNVIYERPGGRQDAGLKLICILRHHPRYELKAFHEHWLHHHGGLFQTIPGLRDPLYAYEQNHSVELPEAQYDGVTEQWFGSLPEWIASLEDPAVVEKVNPDVADFLDPASIQFVLVGKRTVVIG